MSRQATPGHARRRHTRTLLVAPLLLCLTAFPISAAETIDPEKLAAIEELIDVTGAVANSEQFARMFSDQMVGVLRASNPDVSDEAVRIVTEEVNRAVNDELGAERLKHEIYAIYARHFTTQELDALIAFNKSPVGRKANQVMPELLKESMQAAQAWSRDIGPVISERILERFQREGIKAGKQAPHDGP